MRPWFLLILAAFVTVSFSHLSAEGFEARNGRYSGGPVIEITMTRPQANNLRHHYQPQTGFDLHLTKTQRLQIQKKTHLSNPPTHVIVYRITDVRNICTCFAANVAFILPQRRLELPLEYLCSDKEAKDRGPADD
jgi:hypothetical protein